MKPYQEFLDDYVGVNRFIDEETGKLYVDFMTRDQYYKLYMNGITPKAFYDWLVKEDEEQRLHPQIPRFIKTETGHYITNPEYPTTVATRGNPTDS